MIDLDDKVPCFGTAGSRGMAAAELLRIFGEQCGRFEQNEIEIVVYQDSTERELMWQYQAKRLAASSACR